MTMVDNTVTGVSRSIARLDEHAMVGLRDKVVIDGLEWTGQALVESVAENIAFQLERNLPPGEMVTIRKRDVRFLMASHGASMLTVEIHANRLARMIRNR